MIFNALLSRKIQPKEPKKNWGPAKNLLGRRLAQILADKDFQLSP